MKKIIFLICTVISVSLTSDNSIRIVHIKDLNFEIETLGKGKPTIIFENGMGTTMKTWSAVSNTLAKSSKLLLYNRSGLGNSDTAITKRTIPNIVIDLKNILKHEKIKPPYIIVAHSMGSYIARYFAIKYPKDVAGMVLLDPSPDKMYNNYTEQEYRSFKAHGDNNFKSSGAGEKREWESYFENRKYVQQAIPNSIPVYIVSATEWDFYKFQESIMNKNEKSKHFRLQGGHYIHTEKPDSVIAIINKFIEEIK